MGNLNRVNPSNVFGKQQLVFCGGKEKSKLSAMKNSTGFLLFRIYLNISTVSVLKLLRASRPRTFFLPIPWSQAKYHITEALPAPFILRLRGERTSSLCYVIIIVSSCRKHICTLKLDIGKIYHVVQAICVVSVCALKRYRL